MLSHELAHIKNRDVMVMTWASIIVIMAGYLMQMLFWLSLSGGFVAVVAGKAVDS